MPKVKTQSGAKKRFKVTAHGKIKRAHGGYSHLNSCKRTARKRRLRKTTVASAVDQKRVKKMLNI